MSPDHQTIAVSWREENTLHVARVGVDGRGYRELHTTVLDPVPGLSQFPDPDIDAVIHERRLGDLEWSADGHSILFYQPPSHGMSGLMRIPADGGTPALLWQPTFNRFSLSPGGTHYARENFDAADELWALDNVSSVLK